MAISKARKPLRLPPKKLPWLEMLDKHMQRFGNVVMPRVLTPRNRPKSPPEVPPETAAQRRRRRALDV